MSTTVKQDADFGNKYLEDICGWIGDHLNPEDVFSEKDLIAWAEAWAKDQPEWISDPDQWALENGYTKE